MKTLYPTRKLKDIPQLQLNMDGIYLTTILLAGIILSVMVGVYV